ncbi:MAG TPA: hypothetical protein VGR51_07930 [Thermoplasmata archaeon]|nr:hypothetical protein [Thermoplasmata archaeon]
MDAAKGTGGNAAGRLRPGYAKVAGVVTTAVLDELLLLKEALGLPSLSQAVGAALQEWLLARRRGVQNATRAPDGPRASDQAAEALNGNAAEAPP